jgi:hypothetical protein
MRTFVLLGCALFLVSPGCNLPPLPRGPEAAAQAPRADAAPASLPERIERGAGGVRAALASAYGRVWDGIEIVGSSGPVWILMFPIGFVGNLMGPGGGWR